MNQPSVPQGAACPHAGSRSPSSHCHQHAVGSLHPPAPHPLCRGGHHDPTTAQDLFPMRCKNKQGFGSHVSTTRCGTTSFPGRGKPCYLLCISHCLHDAHEPDAAGCVRVCNKPSTRPMVPYPLRADLLQLSPPRPSTHCRQPPGHPAAPRTFPALPGARARGKVTVLQVSLSARTQCQCFPGHPVEAVSHLSVCAASCKPASPAIPASTGCLQPAKPPGSDGTAGRTALPTQKPTDGIP